jgi:ferredoxin
VYTTEEAAALAYQEAFANLYRPLEEWEYRPIKHQPALMAPTSRSPAADPRSVHTQTEPHLNDDTHMLRSNKSVSSTCLPSSMLDKIKYNGALESFISSQKSSVVSSAGEETLTRSQSASLPVRLGPLPSYNSAVDLALSDAFTDALTDTGVDSHSSVATTASLDEDTETFIACSAENVLADSIRGSSCRKLGVRRGRRALKRDKGVSPASTKMVGTSTAGGAVVCTSCQKCLKRSPRGMKTLEASPAPEPPLELIAGSAFPLTAVILEEKARIPSECAGGSVSDVGLKLRLGKVTRNMFLTAQEINKRVTLITDLNHEESFVITQQGGDRPLCAGTANAKGGQAQLVLLRQHLQDLEQQRSAITVEVLKRYAENRAPALECIVNASSHNQQLAAQSYHETGTYQILHPRSTKTMSPRSPVAAGPCSSTYTAAKADAVVTDDGLQLAQGLSSGDGDLHSNHLEILKSKKRKQTDKFEAAGVTDPHIPSVSCGQHVDIASTPGLVTVPYFPTAAQIPWNIEEGRDLLKSCEDSLQHFIESSFTARCSSTNFTSSTVEPETHPTLCDQLQLQYSVHQSQESGDWETRLAVMEHIDAVQLEDDDLVDIPLDHYEYFALLQDYYDTNNEETESMFSLLTDWEVHPVSFLGGN